jgi:hypothetical protein
MLWLIVILVVLSAVVIGGIAAKLAERHRQAIFKKDYIDPALDSKQFVIDGKTRQEWYGLMLALGKEEFERLSAPVEEDYGWNPEVLLGNALYSNLMREWYPDEYGPYPAEPEIQKAIEAPGPAITYNDADNSLTVTRPPSDNVNYTYNFNAFPGYVVITGESEGKASSLRVIADANYIDKGRIIIKKALDKNALNELTMAELIEKAQENGIILDPQMSKRSIISEFAIQGYGLDTPAQVR